MTGWADFGWSILKRHGLWVTALLTVCVFFGLFLFGNAPQVIRATLSLELWRIGALVGLVLVSYGLRFLKWEYYLRELDITIPARTSFLVFYSGLMMVVTPGKAGEVWKAWFLRKLRDVPVTQTVSVVGAERVTDLLALSAFALLGLVVYNQSSTVVLGIIAVFVTGIGLLQWRSFCLRAIRTIEPLPLIGTLADDLRTFYDGSYRLFQLTPLSVALGLSLLAWGLEGVALFILLEGFGVPSSLLESLFVFGFGSVVGAASLLPGGLGAAEASMVGLLVVLGYSHAIAVSATIVIRVGTLWFGAAIGTAVFVVYRHS